MPKHPHHFAFLAILLGLLSLGTTLITEVSVKAVDNTGTLTTVSGDTSSSTDVTKTTTSTTTITDESKTEPILNTDSDNEIETTAIVACSYTYSAWSACSTSGTQTRSVVYKTPSGCYPSADPILKQSCVYIAPTEPKTDCTYVLSDWSTCSTSGTQNRNILSRAPAGCHDSDVPSLQRTCVYSSPVISDSSGSAKTDTNAAAPDSGVTPPFIFLNINGGEVISDAVKIQGAVSNAQNVEFYLVPTDSNISKYLGLAQKLDGNVWEYYFDSKKQPNGSYYLKAKIKNAYGAYEGGQRMLIVLNAGEDPPYLESEDQKFAAADNQPSSEWQKKYFKSDNCVDKNICGGMADPDKDGMNNNEEYRYGTNPTNPDSDGDGFLDGDEIANGYNPLKPSPGDKSDKIVFESPKEKGEIKKDFYQVSSVELVQSVAGNKKLKISGKGIPNSFVTIYIYSDPIILTVKTDKDGNWSYEIDKDVENGEHQIFVAVTDNTGKITAKSEPLAFVKTAEAVSVVPPVEAAASQKSSSPAKNQAKKDLFFFLALVIGGLALALASIGLYRHNAHKKEISDNIN